MGALGWGALLCEMKLIYFIILLFVYPTLTKQTKVERIYEYLWSLSLYVVLEYVESKWVCDGSGALCSLGESTARNYLRDIVAGLSYLHSHVIFIPIICIRSSVFSFFLLLALSTFSAKNALNIYSVHILLPNISFWKFRDKGTGNTDIICCVFKKTEWTQIESEAYRI